MQKSSLGKLILPIWSVLFVSLFISLPGKLSFIHWANLDNLNLFLFHFTEGQDWLYYFAGLFQSLAGTALFSVALVSLGAAIAKWLGIENAQNSETTTSNFALAGTYFLLGEGICSILFLTLAGLYRITPIYVGLILSIGFLLGFKQLIKFSPKVLICKNIKLCKRFEKKSHSAIFWLSIGIVFLSLLLSAARISYDSSAIYFSDAKLTAITERIQYFVKDAFAASEFQSAILFTALIQIAGDQSARMLSWIFGVTIIVFSIAIGNEIGLSKPGRLILLVLLVTSTAFMDLFGDGKVDLISSAPAIAAIYWMILENQSTASNKSLLILTGFFLGFAATARPFNVFLLAVFAGLYYLKQLIFSKPRRKRFVGTAIWICTGAIGPVAYHLFANWMILGDPFAPIANVTYVDSAEWQWAFDPNQLLAIRLLYPFAATFLNSPQSLGNISPIFLAFLPAVFFREIKERVRLSKELLILTSISAITLLLWIFLFFTVAEIRYVFFLWIIIFMPLAEITAEVLDSEDRLIRNIFSGLIITLLLFSMWRTAYLALGTYSPIDKEGNPQCFTSQFCQYLRSINETASPGDRVLSLTAFRYYLRQDLFACSTKAEEYSILRELSYRDAENFWLEVYRQGYKYIAYENDYTARHLQFGLIPDPERTPEWIILRPIYGKPGDLQIAYEIIISSPPIETETTCQLNPSGIWEMSSIRQPNY